MWICKKSIVKNWAKILKSFVIPDYHANPLGTRIIVVLLSRRKGDNRPLIVEAKTKISLSFLLLHRVQTKCPASWFHWAPSLLRRNAVFAGRINVGTCSRPELETARSRGHLE